MGVGAQVAPGSPRRGDPQSVHVDEIARQGLAPMADDSARLRSHSVMRHCDMKRCESVGFDRLVPRSSAVNTRREPGTQGECGAMREDCGLRQDQGSRSAAVTKGVGRGRQRAHAVQRMPEPLPPEHVTWHALLSRVPDREGSRGKLVRYVSHRPSMQDGGACPLELSTALLGIEWRRSDVLSNGNRSFAATRARRC